MEVSSKDTTNEVVKCEELEKVTIDTNQEKYFQIGIQNWNPIATSGERGMVSFPSKI